MGNQYNYSEMRKQEEQSLLIHSLERLCKTYIELADDPYIPREGEGGKTLHDAFTKVIAAEAKKFVDITIPQPRISLEEVIKRIEQVVEMLALEPDEWKKVYEARHNRKYDYDLACVCAGKIGIAQVQLETSLYDLGVRN